MSQQNQINVDGLELYAVRNQDGQWFRRRGYGGYGESWTDDIRKATIYQKIGQARSRVTFWATNYPDYGVPQLVKFTVSGAVVLDEEERVKKADEKKKIAKARHEARWAKAQLEQAQQQLQTAQAKMKKLSQGAKKSS